MPHIKQRFSSWQRTVAFLLPLALMGLIFILSSISQNVDVPGANVVGWIPPALQNLLHIPLYGLLTFLWFGALAALGLPGHWRLVTAAVIAFVFGLFDEWHQLSVPGRFGTLTDVVLNLLGIISGLWFCAYFQRRFWS